MKDADSRKESDDLAELVRQLTKEVRTLWEAVDDLREGLFAEFQSLRGEPLDDSSDEPADHYRLKSMPLDPCARDFHQRVNVIDSNLGEKEAATLSEFLEQLIRNPPTQRLTIENWVEDQEFDPDETVEIDGEIFDWFAEYLVTVHHGQDCYVLDGDEDSYFALWNRDSRCFVRRLTESEQDDFFRLSGISRERIEPADESSATSMLNVPAERQETQNTLW